MLLVKLTQHAIGKHYLYIYIILSHLTYNINSERNSKP